MHRIRVSLLSILAALHWLGCVPAFNAPARVMWYLDNRESIWTAVAKDDFRGADPTAATPTSDGSNLLMAAIHFSDGVTGSVADNGIPDGIRIVFTGDVFSLPQATCFELAYLARDTVIVVGPREHNRRPLAAIEEDPILAQVRPSRSYKPIDEPSPAEPEEPPYETRVLTDEDRAAVDPELALRREIERWARVLTVGRAVLLQVEPSDIADGSNYANRPGFYYGYLTATVTPASARLFGGTADAPGRYIVWTDPDGPAASILEVGWRILTINDQPVASFEAKEPGEEVELVLERMQERRTVRLSPERFPLDVSFGVWSLSSGTAFAGMSESRAHVGIAGPFLDLLPSDDAVAALLGHEIAHVLLTVDSPPPVSEQAASAGIWMTLGILSPAIAQGLVDRFQHDDERAADVLGTRLAHRAGYDPFGGVVVLDVLREHRGEASVGDVLSTHPPYRERRQLMYDEAQRLRGARTPG